MYRMNPAYVQNMDDAHIIKQQLGYDGIHMVEVDKTEMIQEAQIHICPH